MQFIGPETTLAWTQARFNVLLQEVNIHCIHRVIRKVSGISNYSEISRVNSPFQKIRCNRRVVLVMQLIVSTFILNKVELTENIGELERLRANSFHP